MSSTNTSTGSTFLEAGQTLGTVVTRLVEKVGVLEHNLALLQRQVHVQVGVIARQQAAIQQ